MAVTWATKTPLPESLRLDTNYVASLIVLDGRLCLDGRYLYDPGTDTWSTRTPAIAPTWSAPVRLVRQATPLRVAGPGPLRVA